MNGTKFGPEVKGDFLFCLQCGEEMEKSEFVSDLVHAEWICRECDGSFWDRKNRPGTWFFLELEDEIGKDDFKFPTTKEMKRILKLRAFQ